MLPENMPYYQGPCIVSDPPEPSQPATIGESSSASPTEAVISSITSTSFSNNLVWFGTFPSTVPVNMDVECRKLYNSEYPVFAFRASRFVWAVYSFNSGHFASTFSKQNLPFLVSLACDPFAHGRALFKEFTH
jgi:hypothetical protein